LRFPFIVNPEDFPVSNSDTGSTTVAQVDVQSAWLSKTNWGEVVKVAAAFAAVKGVNVPPEVQNDVLLTIISVGGLYTWVVKTWFTKTITPGSAASPQVSTSTVTLILLAAFVLSLFLPATTRAADVLSPVKTPAPVTSLCTLSSCSGWYVGAGLTGDGSNADIIGNGINQSVFSSGGILDVHGGYQLWNGTYFAAAEGSLGNEFTRNQRLSSIGAQTLVGYEIVKLGVGLAGLLNPSSATAPTTPGQSPVAINVPASIANMLMSPYVTFGAMQRRGISQWVSGAGAEFVVASGWSLDIRYLYAPSQDALPSTNLVTLGLNRHF
jgi:hypothetical protein